MLRRDLIVRMIQDMARLLVRAMGFRAKGLLPEAIAEVEAGAKGLLGLDLKLVEVVEPGALAAQLGEPARVALLARLSLARAELAEDAGDPSAPLWRRRAVELWLEAGAAGEVLEDDALRAIAGHPAGELGPRQQRLREALVG